MAIPLPSPQVQVPGKGYPDGQAVQRNFDALALQVTAPSVWRKTSIATEEARTNTAYGTLTTPDQVTGLVVPTDGLLYVVYRALVKSSVGNAARGAIFIGANQMKQFSGTSAPVVQESPAFGTADDYEVLQTSAQAFGLTTVAGAGAASFVTTGTGLSHVLVEVAAGVYDVSVQFKATSGSVTAKERKLWVKAEA